MTNFITPNFITQGELETLIKFGAGLCLLDVRKLPAFEADSAMIKGAVHRDPFQVGSWAEEIPLGRIAVCYCVHGHEVSQGVAEALAERGVDAYFLKGGMDGWKAASGFLTPKP